MSCVHLFRRGLAAGLTNWRAKPWRWQLHAWPCPLASHSTTLRCLAIASASSSGSNQAASSSVDVAKVTLRPPGSGSSEEKAQKFFVHLDRTLELGETVELSAWGNTAVRNVLRAFVAATKSVKFQVSWDSLGRGTESHRSLRFVVASGLPWEKYLENRSKNTQGLFVQGKTKHLQLARSVAKALEAAPPEDAKAIRVHTFLDDENAVGNLVKGLASASAVYPYHELSCVANAVCPLEDPRERLFVYVTGTASGIQPSITGASFQAMPPGIGAEPEHVRKFNEAVQDRLHRGDRVTMECRGPDAVLHCVRSLCLLQGHAASFRVSWAAISRVSNKTEISKRDQGMNVLQVQAERGPTWDDFNATNFTKTDRLVVAPASHVQALAWAAVKEVRRDGAVSLHCYSDNTSSVNVLMKAIATVPPLTGGQKLICIPSFGRVGARKDPVLRVYVRLDREDTPEGMRDVRAKSDGSGVA
eukprot:TRINITY_DN42905_c0_g1_i1.p1 TRINITY_DN42905_c0_g1~~TRINITY_DN42905_c0_g1_i1.p1  ORF type:complete len:473 (-),score=72.39 TRINITY_DN42905_c0_g1_i1:96-1514(-)